MSEAAKVVDEHSGEIQKLYAQRYNLRSTRKVFSVRNQVLVMQSEGGSKLQPKWKGPVVVKEKTRTDSYVIVNAEGAERLVHANKLRQYHARAKNVAVVFEADAEFGNIEMAPQAISSCEQICVTPLANDLSSGQSEELNAIVKEYREVMSERPGRSRLGDH
ncbi:hypothetical protein MRX96_029772 [Rhipicephalus microplus]